MGSPLGYRRIGGGSAQPGGKELDLTQAAYLLKCFAKNVLHEILNLVAILHVASDFATYEWLVTHRQFTKGHCITRASFVYQH